jgi:Domain of unknown function (DUF4261)
VPRIIPAVALATLCCSVADAAPRQKPKDLSMNLAFVLLSRPVMPKEQDVVKAFARFVAKGESLKAEGTKSDTKSDGKSTVTTFGLGPHGSAFVALMPIAVPNGEADEVAGNSLSALGMGWKLPPHHAHLVVSLTAPATEKPLEALQRFTSLVAAVTQAAPAVGVYWGDAHVTHDPKFFVETAAQPGVMPRITLWNGISVAKDGAARVSLLSLGMKQLGLPDLLLTAPRAKLGLAVESMFDLLSYLVDVGKPLPEGDTVGPTEHDKWKVHYVPSPTEPGEQVWRIELP